VLQSAMTASGSGGIAGAVLDLVATLESAMSASGSGASWHFHAPFTADRTEQGYNATRSDQNYNATRSDQGYQSTRSAVD
jgi:hypothetical protein